MADAVNWAQRLSGDAQSGTLPGPGGAFEMWHVLVDEPVASTAEVDSIINAETKGYRIGEFQFFGIWVDAAVSSGTANYTVEILESYDDTAANYVKPDVGSLVVTVADNNPHVVSVFPVPMAWLRFRVTGIGANPASAVINLRFWMQS